MAHGSSPTSIAEPGDSPPLPAIKSPQPRPPVTASAMPLTPARAVQLAILFGLCGGYLDIVFIALGKHWWTPDGYFRNARDFPWTVPAGHALLLLIPGLIIAARNAQPARRISLRTAVWLYSSLTIWGAFLRTPLNGSCTLLLSLGLGRVVAGRIASSAPSPRTFRFVTAAALGIVLTLAAASSGWPAIKELRSVAALPPPPVAARNVILIVWDTVRAYNVSSYGANLDTTPNLSRWAQKGVQFNRAIAPAPWTYPSHCSFMTGHWPHKLNAQWKFTLDGPEPTLAEFLASNGYQTAGFAANTNWCTYETGLSRGFSHFDDYPLSPRAFLSRTVPGKWLLEQILTLGAYIDPSLGAFYDKKWAAIQSRGARQINNSFLNWLSRRRPDRPFFAFLNYFDAHDPYVPPTELTHHFGIAPKTRDDFQFLFDYALLPKESQGERKLKMAFDSYNDCISFLDEQLNQLLLHLEEQKLLDNTTVIITSDHGEAFGDHGFYGHLYGLSLEEIGVPLIILSPEAPAGKEVAIPVTLRDLPATVVDLAGAAARSPFPGRSLKAAWTLPNSNRSVTAPPLSPAFSEQADSNVLGTNEPNSRGVGEFQMSLVADGHHYVRGSSGSEHLFNLTVDPLETNNLIPHPVGHERAPAFRRMLLDFLTQNPGADAVENAYLNAFRQKLQAAVEATTKDPPRPQ